MDICLFVSWFCVCLCIQSVFVLEICAFVYGGV